MQKKNSKGHLRNHARIVKVGGWAFILATIFYPILTLNSDLPSVLQGGAEDVLPRLLSFGGEGRAFLSILSLIPLILLIPAAFGAMEALKRDRRILMEFAFILLVLASIGFSFGILRWAAVTWQIGFYWEQGSAEKYWVEQIYDYINLYFGTFIGQFLAEVAFYGFMLVTSSVLVRSKRFPLWLGLSGLIIALLGIAGTFRHTRPEAEAFYDVVQFLRLVPLWMLAFGLALLLYNKRSQGESNLDDEKMRTRARQLKKRAAPKSES